MNFAATARMYEMRQRVSISLSSVDHQELREWSLAVRRFCGTIPVDIREHRLWREAVVRLRRLNGEFCSVPLPFSVIGHEHAEGLRELERAIASSSAAYPALSADCLELIGRAAQLCAISDSPIMEFAFMEGLLESGTQGVALALSRSRWQGRVEEELASLELDEVAVHSSVPALLKESWYRVICVGPPEWFGEALLFAPPTLNLCFLGYSFIRLDAGPRPLAYWKPDSRGSWEASGLPTPTVTTPDRAEVAEDSEILDGSFVLPSINWQSFLLNLEIAEDGEGAVSGSDLVEPRAVLLSDAHFVLLRGHDRATASVLRYDHGEPEVELTTVTALEAGTYVLLRTEGGGDLVVDLAQGLLGDQADEIETAQLAWKIALRDIVKRRGLSGACAWLRHGGVSGANEGTVRYWVSDDSIQPGSLKDFRALMQAIGLGDQAKDTWAKGRALRTARLRAAWQIRKRLLTIVGSSDESVFEGGRLQFSLGGGIGGSLTAWEVMAVSPTRSLVSATRIGVPESLEEQLWLG